MDTLPEVDEGAIDINVVKLIEAKHRWTLGP